MVPTHYFALFIYLFVPLSIILVIIALSRRGNGMLQSLAQRIGLQFTKGTMLQPAKLEGNYNSHRTFIGTTYEGYGKNRRSFFTITIDCENILYPFTLTEENFLTRFGKKIGFKEAQLGNPGFDEKFYISGEKDPEKIRKVLTPEVQTAFMNFSGRYKIEFTPNKMTYKTLHYPKETDALSILSKLVQIIKEIETRGEF